MTVYEFSIDLDDNEVYVHPTLYASTDELFKDLADSLHSICNMIHMCDKTGRWDYDSNFNFENPDLLSARSTVIYEESLASFKIIQNAVINQDLRQVRLANGSAMRFYRLPRRVAAYYGDT